MRTTLNRMMTIVLALAIGQIYICAQTIVSGTAIDSNGNPVQGALVEADGITTTTGFDGTFNIEVPASAKSITVTYVGFTPETKSIKQDMVFKLGKKSWWNEEAQPIWIIGPQALFTAREMNEVKPGIMIGWVKKWGAYAKGFFWPEKSTDSEYEPSKIWYTGKVARSHYGGVAGVMYRLNCPIYFNAGFGVMDRKFFAQRYDGGWSSIESRYHGIHCVIDVGVMIKFKKVLINASGMYNFFKEDEYGESMSINNRFMVNVGVNYCF